jgi:hypothetical protein
MIKKQTGMSWRESVDVEMGEKDREQKNRQTEIGTQQNCKIDLGICLTTNSIDSEGGLWVSEQ